MTESVASSDQTINAPIYPSSNNRTNQRKNNNNHRRRDGQNSSQDVRYNQRAAQQQQQWQPRYPQNDEFYYGQPPPPRGYHVHHQQPHQWRGAPRYPPQQYFYGHPGSFPHQQHQAIGRSNASSMRSTNEGENLRSSLIEQLFDNAYECMICIIKIDRDQAIWSCDICFKMFHLNCLQKWANSEESGSDKNWRCPGCQYSYSTNPNYFCFCRKQVNPPFMPGEIPHSCGEICGKRLNIKSNDCNHFCSELCHPGSCANCTTMVKRSCLCTRERRTVMCSSNAIIKCENICGKLKSCKHHACQLVCHPRECEPCEEMIKQNCLSHDTERQVLCTSETGKTTSFTCGEPCGKVLTCGHHTCSKLCHDGPCPSCSLLPENCTTCSCGQTTIVDQQRTSCLDPLPTCDKSCGKILPCGPSNDHHRCSGQCHNGSCPPCDKQSILKCRCGQSSKPTSCTEAIQYDPIKNPFLCERRCTKRKLCGKHRCNELCCERDVHICEIICGKLLNCGVHKCEELCHKNLCRKCPVNSYDELTCRCGRTIIQPPISCGTQPPTCNYKCERTHICDHPVYHSCHNDDECPPCTHLVSKMCIGNHTIRNSVPCHLKEVLCGQTCGKLLPCDVHTCQRSCHSGLCQSLDHKCIQKCLTKRRECGHPCNALCHSHESCPITTCREIIKVRCPCGRLVKDIICNIKPNETNIDEETNLAQSIVQALSVRTLDLSAMTRNGNIPQIECDDECRVIQRNRNFANALSLNIDEHRTQQTPVIYTDFLRDYTKKNFDFVQTIERQFVQLVEETQRHRVAKRCHSFKPMKTNERHLIHELATFYGLETQAMDPEPNRNVVAYASFGMCKLPSITLSETIRREKSKVPPPVTIL